jgi:phosphatidylserine/phosphatidylglycerophosphate/cardiolipin synthase-like enzyme
MSDLSVSLGARAREAFCDAFDDARTSIDAEFFSITDAAIVDSLNRAAARGVQVRVAVEGDPHRFRHSAHPREPGDRAVRGGLDASVDVVVSHTPHALVHGKAAVVDDSVALIATANATATGFDSPGEALVVDRDGDDVRSVQAEIADAAAGIDRRPQMRPQLDDLFRAPCDLRVASEDLSDPKVVAWLVHRVRVGHHDRILVGRRPSHAAKKWLHRLADAGVDVRIPERGYMHEKFIDAGARLYVGSANLTRDGIDESHEVGIIAAATDFADAAASLRADFDSMWRSAVSTIR